MFSQCLAFLDSHASDKSVLEVQFTGEVGHGHGPTLEFYSLMSGEWRRRSTKMWIADSISDAGDAFVEGKLFPAPIPKGSPILEDVCSKFFLCGQFFAKAMQDSRLLDMP